MGRKAWLFCWTEVGAEHVGWIQSLISRIAAYSPPTANLGSQQRQLNL
jgi:hypothetical protein